MDLGVARIRVDKIGAAKLRYPVRIAISCPICKPSEMVAQSQS
jgi:hypothetical protein